MTLQLIIGQQIPQMIAGFSPDFPLIQPLRKQITHPGNEDFSSGNHFWSRRHFRRHDCLILFGII